MQIIDTGADDVIGVCIDGRIETQDIDRITALVEEKLGAHDKLRVYVELVRFQGITLEGLWKDLQLGFGNLRAFERKAVVSDKAWLGKVTEIADSLFPGIQVKHFSTDERDAALDWVKA